MKTLIVEDDAGSSFLLKPILKSYGPLDTAASGEEAVAAATLALDQGTPYTLICMDIMMPVMDGQQALQEIRAREKARGILSTNGSKIVMTTALDDIKNLVSAFGNLCDGYVTKPISKAKLLGELRGLGLIDATDSSA